VRLLPRRVVPSSTLIAEVRDEVLREQNSELEMLRTELARLRPMQEAQVKGLAHLLTQAWLTPSEGRQGKVFFDDPVWGHNCVDEELCPLFFHPLVQRLNYIKQLSFAYLTFPNATHSRLAHSLGTCRNLEASLTTIFRNNVLYTTVGREPISLDGQTRRELIIKAKTAALLHDVGHAPFGHALDKLIGYFDPTQPLAHPDKHYSKLYLQRHLVAGLPKVVSAENLSRILSQNRTDLPEWDNLIADLLDSSIDVDRMDFLVRDAHMTGLSMGVTSVEAIIERMCPFQDGDQIFLTFDDSSLAYIDDFLLAREKMYAYCYENPSKLAAERIFTRLVESLIRDHRLEMDVVMLLTDEQILALLGVAAIGSERDARLLDALLQNIQYICVLEVDLKENNANVAQWTKARDSARMRRWAYVESPSTWENNIASAAGLEERNSWRILVTIPDQKTGVPNEIEAPILKREGNGYQIRPLFEVYPKLRKQLKDEYIPRGRIRVFADSRLTGAQKLEVEKAAKELLSHG
jgi:HD superfamily phosphohydrolase